MAGDLAIAFALSVVVLVLVIVTPGIYARYFGPRCPSCGIRPFGPCDGDIWYDPAPSWTLYRCDQCDAEFIHDSAEYTPRSEWRGDPDAESTFQSLDDDLPASGRS